MACDCLFLLERQQRTIGRPRTGETKEYISIIFLDHIVAKYRTQNRLRVIRILGAVLVRLTVDFPEIKVNINYKRQLKSLSERSVNSFNPVHCQTTQIRP